MLDEISDRVGGLHIHRLPLFPPALLGALLLGVLIVPVVAAAALAAIAAAVLAPPCLIMRGRRRCGPDVKPAGPARAAR
jgi:hypothetical protein